MDGYRLFDVTLTTINPLHIGSGRTLLRDYDFAVRGERTYRLDEDAILAEQKADDPAAAKVLARTAPAQLVEKLLGTPAGEPFARYVAAGVPRSSSSGAQVSEQIKTAFDELYIPGSSLKGALRTALAWRLWGQRALRPEISRLGNRAKFAASPVEKVLFGADPNHDLLRALQVGDSAPAGKKGLMLVNARVLTRRGLSEEGAPIDLEAIPGDRSFTLPVKLDLRLFTPWAERAGLPQDGGDLLLRLPAVVQEHAADRIAREARWYEGIERAEPILGFYRQLAGLKFGGRRCLVQLGWGTGWESKTLGSRLRADARFMERIMESYRMTRGVKVAPERYPTSRRVVMHVERGPGQTDERPAAPLGWCVLEFKERK